MMNAPNYRGKPFNHSVPLRIAQLERRGALARQGATANNALLAHSKSLLFQSLVPLRLSHPSHLVDARTASCPSAPA